VLTCTVYRVGGGSRLSGLMLTAATAAVMFVGPTVISYLRELESTKYDPADREF